MEQHGERVHLSGLEREVHAWVVEHADELEDMTIRDLAAKTYSNTTTILRYARKLGYKGFSDFKMRIKDDLRRQRAPEVVVRSSDSAINVINKVRQLNISTIERASSKLSLEQLDRIVSHFEKADSVDFIAYDANAAIAQYASHCLFQVGKLCTVLQDIDQQMIFAQNVDTRRHTIVLISRSGRTARLIKVLEELRRRYAYTVLFCGDASAPACSMASEVVECDFIDSFEQMGDCLFYVSVKYQLDLLINLYYSRNYQAALKTDSVYTHAYDSLQQR